MATKTVNYNDPLFGVMYNALRTNRALLIQQKQLFLSSERVERQGSFQNWCFSAIQESYDRAGNVFNNIGVELPGVISDVENNVTNTPILSQNQAIDYLSARLDLNAMVNSQLTQTPQINSAVYPEQPYTSLAMFLQCEDAPWSFYDPTSPTYFEDLKTAKWQLP